MITAFMVFKRESSPSMWGPWRLYYTTTDRDVDEDRIKEDANTYGWRVVKVTLDDALNGTCETL